MTTFGAISTCRTARLQWARSRAVTLLRVLTRLRSAVEKKVSRPMRSHRFALTAAHPSPCAHSNVCCVHPKRPCIAPRTHFARPGPVPFPQHAHALVPRSSPHVCRAHLSGQCWRLLGLQVMLFGAISTCRTAPSQRAYSRALALLRLLTLLRSTDEIKVRRPVTTHPFALTAA